MKLAIVTETFPPEINGVAMTFGVIARELANRGHLIAVYRPRRPDLPDHETPREYRQISMPGVPIPGYPQLRLGLPARRKLRRLWSEDRPDLVHVATEGPLGITAIRAAQSLSIPVTSSFHTNFHAYADHYGISLFRRAALAWLRHVHNLTQRTFVPTADLCSELSSLGFKNLAVLSRGVDTRQFRPERRSPVLRAEWGAAPDDPVVIHVGRMAAEKNYPLLFRVYAAMKKANPACRFVLAGEGPLKRALMRDHPECVFAGFFSRDEIGRYYASADVYIHASLTETFGNVLTEAMSSGLAAGGFDYAAARMFIRDGENGLIAPCESPDLLIAAGVRLATDQALRNRLRAAGRAAVEAQSWEKVIALFENDLERAAGVERTPAGPAPVLV
ncbi:MAG TPA: glycosyltransferase family 1 protein [Opitutaceae bacterium]|nr:glycosyltransferase family 1 protein [Opitutaceae bacterium]